MNLNRKKLSFCSAPDNINLFFTYLATSILSSYQKVFDLHDGVLFNGFSRKIPWVKFVANRAKDNIGPAP